MGEATRALLGTLVLLIVVVGGIGVFLTTAAHVLSQEGHVTTRQKAEVIGATVFLVLLIAGGFFWLRFISVGMM